MLVGKYSLERRYWTIRVVCDQHNHRPTNHLEGYAYARRLSDDEFRLVEELTWKNVPPREILSTLKDQDETNLSTLPTIYEAQKKIRKNEKGAKTPMLSMYINSGECIPLEAIDIFWRTLSLSLAKSLQIDHIRYDSELNHFKEHFNKQSEAGKRSFLRKLVDIFNPIAVGLGLDKNMWPLIRQELLQELRYHEHDYTDIFTSIGFNFIWNTVDFLGTGFAPTDKWMSLPDTGLVVALFYRRPVVFISMVENDVLSSTCFPLWSDPHESESTEPIVVARVGGSHFINLLLRECYPIPSTHPQWRTYRIDRTSAWEDMYSNQQLAFEEYIRCRRQMY
ncbi:hypothetical protein Tco_1084936 [Tanacetum coccineum]